MLLAWPGPEVEFEEDPGAWLFLDRPHLDTLRNQARAVEAAYQAEGARVHFCHPSTDSYPNFLFQRDLYLLTPEGAILGRPAARQRAGEERHAAAALAALGVPILATTRGEATFEGADVLWLSPDRTLLGEGIRTNAAGRAHVVGVLGDLGVHVDVIPMPRGVQHLLGIVNFADRRLATLDAARAPAALVDLLVEAGYDLLLLPPDPELLVGRGMNFVATAPGRVLMPAGCPGIRARLEERGVVVHEVEISEYLKAAGGVGCLTGILRRRP